MAEYSGPVVDAHHSIWLRKDVAWLSGPPKPHLYGDIFGLRRDYTIDEYLRDAAAAGVTKSVHVSALWGADRAVDESRWLQSVADKHGFPHAFIAQADLANANVEATLKAHKQIANVRGIYHPLYWDTQMFRRAVPKIDFCNSPDFRRGFALLEQYDLSFELQVYAYQARHVVDLLKAFPKVRFVLAHAGMLSWRAPEAFIEWRAGLSAMAAFPNLHVKLSGLGMYSDGVTLPQARQTIRDTIQIFGAERVMYGSNFPAEKLHEGYADYFTIVRKVLSEYTEADQRAILHDNAVKFYGL